LRTKEQHLEQAHRRKQPVSPGIYFADGEGKVLSWAAPSDKLRISWRSPGGHPRRPPTLTAQTNHAPSAGGEFGEDTAGQDDRNRGTSARRSTRGALVELTMAIGFVSFSLLVVAVILVGIVTALLGRR
jgi:hypothetical protein